MEDGGRGERKSVRESLERRGDIVFQQGRVSIIKGKKKVYDTIEVSNRTPPIYGYARTA